jgi:hypothetical protein
VRKHRPAPDHNLKTGSTMANNDFNFTAAEHATNDLLRHLYAQHADDAKLMALASALDDAQDAAA